MQWVQTEEFGVVSDKTLGGGPRGEAGIVVGFDSLEKGGTDLGDAGDISQVKFFGQTGGLE